MTSGEQRQDAYNGGATHIAAPERLSAPPPAPRVTVNRLGNGPIIRPFMDSRMGDNINGPSLVRAPSWVDQPLGRYYLYFGNHRGTYVRLAYANTLLGPWHTHEPGVLDLADTPFVKHIASPDVLVDDERREVRLYFHGPLAARDRGGPHGTQQQATRVALSHDGVRFEAQNEVLGAPYMRVFCWQGWYYGIGMPGILYRSKDGLTAFEEGPHLPPAEQRHVGLKLTGDTLHVFYSNRGDCPERIFAYSVRLTGNWLDWRPGEAVEVIAPERDYEGANEPRVPSTGGAIDGPAYQLRDPYIFTEGGADYLLYSVAGEQGLAIAEIVIG